MEKNKKNNIKQTILIVIAAIIIIALVVAWLMFGSILKAITTVKEVEPGLYSIEYRGDYGFDKFLKEGGASSDAEVGVYLTKFLSKGFASSDSAVGASAGDYGCTTIAIEGDNGDRLFGRNYDVSRNDTMIIHTIPKNGYESISTTCMCYLDFGDDYVVDGSFYEKMLSISTIYVPMDGMNEKGLVVADLYAGEKVPTNQDTDKVDLTTTTAIRLLLDRAATVDEALALLEEYDMHSSAGIAHHFAIADASGKSVIVEYYNDEMKVMESPVLTNHYIIDNPDNAQGSEQSHERYKTISSYIGPAATTQVAAMLKSVAQFNYEHEEGNTDVTLWSIVYDLTTTELDFYFNENYGACYHMAVGK